MLLISTFIFFKEGMDNDTFNLRITQEMEKDKHGTPSRITRSMTKTTVKDSKDKNIAQDSPTRRG